MGNILIKKGNQMSEVGGNLNCIALDYMAYPLAGSKNLNIIKKTFSELWRLGSNRFSHEYAFEAQLNGKTVGMITCYPAKVMNKLGWETFKKLISLRKFDLICHSIMNFKELMAMLSLNEVKEDEYHIGTLATLPESRGYGVGSKLVQFAEEQAKLNQCDKCSLTVKKENKQALKLYVKLGYKIVDSIENHPYSLFRMVKNLKSIPCLS